MTLIDELAATNDVAMNVAAALERVLGDDVILAVGLPRREPPGPEVLPAGDIRGVLVTLSGALDARVLFFASAELAASLEQRASDEVLTGSLGPALVGGAEEIVRVAGAAGATISEPVEVDAAELLASATEGEFLVYPLLIGSDRVACLAIDTAPTESPGTVAAPAAPPAATVSVHEFPTLDGGALHADVRPLMLLADVEMGVTAELGRRRMSVRELLSLTPGSVIELDRAAGSPVDVLVNGTLIARGEVVVIDEEFGIRISEIVAADVGAR